MTIYIALLRGINVGGHNKIKMAELKQSLEKIGLKRVQTYIQSGNVLLESVEGEEQLRTLIENEITTVFGYTISVIVRTAEELKSIVEKCPFSMEEVVEAEAASDGECLYVALLQEAPLPDRLQRLDTYKGVDDEYRIAGRDIYLLFSNSIRNSKLANNLQRLDVPVTTRNWKTINKLVSLAREMEMTND